MSDEKKYSVQRKQQCEIWAGTIPIERKLGTPITSHDSKITKVPDHILNRSI